MDNLSADQSLSNAEREALTPPHGRFRCPVDGYRRMLPRPRHWLVDQARRLGLVVSLDASGNGLRFRGPVRDLGAAWVLVRLEREKMLEVLRAERRQRDWARALWDALSIREQNAVMWFATALPGDRCPLCTEFLEDTDPADELEEGPDPSCAP